MTLELDLQMAELEMKLLRAQFNSHFLFNNLNAINFSILQNENQKASSYLTQFSRFLRRVAASPSRDFVALSEELETVRQYLQIESLRFARPVRLAVAIDPALDPDCLWIPSLTLHSYVENAIWGSLNAPSSETVLRLGIKKESKKCHILLETNGVSSARGSSQSLFSTKESSLALIAERLRLLNARHGTDIRVEVGSRKDRFSEPSTWVDISFTPFVPLNSTQVP